MTFCRNLLPEDKRKKFVKTVSAYAIEGEDTYALDDEGIRNLFKDDEFEDMRERVRTQLLPRLGDVRREWESNHRPDDPPEEHMQQLLSTFTILKKSFGDDESAVRIIDRETDYANQWVGENAPEEPERSPRKLGNVEAPAKPQSARSIFGDVDADEKS